MKLLIFAALSLAAYGQTKAGIVITVVDDAGASVSAKITGVPASAGLESLTLWMATQKTCVPGTPTPATPSPAEVCTPKYGDAAQLVKAHVVSLLEGIAPQFPSAQTRAVVADIAARQAGLDKARKSLFDTARAEK